MLPSSFPAPLSPSCIANTPKHLQAEKVKTKDFIPIKMI